jgi:hypothetical protein
MDDEHGEAMSQLDDLTPRELHQLEKRQWLWRTALEDALIAGDKIRIPMREHRGVWWPSMGPLTARERTLVLRELKKIWGIPHGN